MAVTRRERAIGAAIELLGTEGVRALTHRRVDERAGLPAGSTSNYFRTRAALFEGILDAMLAVQQPQVAAAFAPRTADEFADALTAVFDLSTGPGRATTAARLALLVEAGHDESLRGPLSRGRAELFRQIVPALEALGAPDPDLAAQLLATTIQGMYLQTISGVAEIDARRVIGLALRAILPPAAQPRDVA